MNVLVILASSITVGAALHVPVDDNPAYITMKRITLNKNTASTAYE